MAVDVVAEMDRAVARGPAGQIDPGDRNLVRELDVHALALGDGGVDLRAAPAGIVLQQPGCECARVFDAGAAGRLEAVVGAEEFLVVGVVHVDRMRIRHVDAHRAERVPRPGILPDGEVRRAVGVPVDGVRIDLAAGTVEHLHVHARRVARVLAHLRDDILLQDAERHRPGRIEVDGRDVGRERRRRTVGAPDLHHVPPHDLVAVDRLGEGGRQVDHHVALPEVEIHRRQPVVAKPRAGAGACPPAR